MVTTPFSNIIKEREKSLSTELSLSITSELKSKPSRKRVWNWKKSIPGDWTLGPSKDLTPLLQKRVAEIFLAKTRGMTGWKFTYELKHKKRSDPSVVVKATMETKKRGGRCVIVKQNHTLAKLSLAEYGYECYAALLADSNNLVGDKKLPLPVNFGLDLPEFNVPEWGNTEPCTVPKSALTKAQVYDKPEVQTTFDKPIKIKFRVPMGFIIIVIEVTIKLDLTVTPAGALGPNYNVRTEQATVTKALGGLQGKWEADLKKKSGKFSAKFAPKQFRGVSFSTEFKPGTGKLSVELGKTKIEKTINGDKYVGSLSGSADITIEPNPALPETASLSSPVKASEINWDAVENAGIAMGTFVVLSGFGLIIIMGASAGILATS